MQLSLFDAPPAPRVPAPATIAFDLCDDGFRVWLASRVGDVFSPEQAAFYQEWTPEDVRCRLDFRYLSGEAVGAEDRESWVGMLAYTRRKLAACWALYQAGVVDLSALAEV